MAESPDNVDKGVVRRRILKGAGLIVVGAAVFGLGREGLVQRSKQDTVRDFSSDDADYRFLGGAHGMVDENHPLNVVTILRKEMIPDDATFFELETGTLDYLSPEVYLILDRVYTRTSSIDFLQEVIPALTEKTLPLVITDVPTPRLDPKFLTDMGGVLIATIGLVASRKDPNLTRRKFVLGGLAVGLWSIVARGLAGELAAYLHSVAQEPWAKRIAEANHYIELSQPESLPLTFRNAVNAAKTLGLENRFPKSSETNRPKGVLLYGSGHWGMPEYFETGKKDLLDYLSLYPKPFIERCFGATNPHLYTSVVITPEGEGFKKEKIEDLDLKKIFA